MKRRIATESMKMKRQSMKRRIATERLSKIYIAICGYTWLDESKWPQEWPISPITIINLKIPSERNEIFLFTQDWVLSLDINRFLWNCSTNRLLISNFC